MKIAIGVSIAAIVCALGVAQAQTANNVALGCSLEGLSAADFKLVPDQMPEGQAPPPKFKCGAFTARFTAAVGGAQMHVEAARLLGESGGEEKADVITIAREAGGKGEQIAKFIMPHAASTAPSYAFKMVKLGDIDALQIAGNATRFVVFEGGKARVLDAFAWLADADKLTPATHRNGRILSMDLSSMQGAVAAFPASAADPKKPGGVNDPASVAVVKLAYADGKLTATSASLRARTADDGEVLGGADDDEDVAALKAARAKAPAGVEPCIASGYSKDNDPAGLNVRAEPDAKAKVLGKLSPPWDAPKEGAPKGGFRTEFAIIGYKNGWFMIEKAKPPGTDYVDKLPRNVVKPYAGRGWVAASMVEAAFANGGLSDGGLRQAPHPDARLTIVTDKQGVKLGPDFASKRLYACSGRWGLFEAPNGVIGWWRGLCSNQVTNCS